MQFRQLATFYILALAISWTCWLAMPGAQEAGATSPLRALHLIGSLGPALAALVVAIWSGPRARSEFARGLGLRGVPAQAWLVGIGGPLVLLAAGLGVTCALSGRAPQLDLVLTSAEYPWLSGAALIAAQLICYGFGEELGWRQFALPRLLERLSPLSASLWLTLPWALWHLPLFFSQPTYAAMGLPEIAGWLASLATGSVLLGWLWLASNRSVWPVALFHGLLDLAMVNPEVGATGRNAAGALVTFAGIAAAVALYRVARHAAAMEAV